MPHTSTPEMLKELVAFDTTSRFSNLEMIAWLKGFLEDKGVPCRLTYNADKTKANIWATIGPDVAGGVVLSGHTDVVPVENQPWQTNPFEAVEKDGALYARGTADMKGFIASCLTHIDAMQAADLKRPLHLAFTYDEEVGCFGVDELIADVTENLPQPRMVLVGEPTDMTLINAHKGIRTFITTFKGKAGHSSKPDGGCSAIFYAARFITYLEELLEELKQTTSKDERFEPNYNTLNVGIIEGGVADNVIPDTCVVEWETRQTPGLDTEYVENSARAFINDTLLPEMQKKFKDAHIELERRGNVVPLEAEDGSPAEALVKELTGANRAGAVSYTTEAGKFQQVGMSAVICGPGSIEQAHQADEFVKLDQLDRCDVFLDKLIDWAATNKA